MWTRKPQNGVPGRGDMSGGLPDCFLYVPGSGSVTIQPGTCSGGGLFHKSGRASSTAHFAISLPGSHLAVVDRPASDDTAGTSRTIATPPFLPLYRQAVGWASSRPCSTACIPPLGVAIVLFIPAGRLRPRPRTQPLSGRETRRRKTP